MTTPNLPPLSPAAQAVMDAAYEELDYVPQRYVRWCAAAALRAAADQVFPLARTPWGSTLIPVLTSQESRRRLLALATELENHQ